MTVGVPEYSLDSWGIKYIKKKTPVTTIQRLQEQGKKEDKEHSKVKPIYHGEKKIKPTGSTSSGLNITDPNWRDQKVHRPEDIGEGSKTHTQSTHTAQVGENKITDMHISHGGTRGAGIGGYRNTTDSKTGKVDEYRAPIDTDAKGGHKGTKLTIGGRGRTSAGYRARQGGAHGTGTEKHPHTLPAEGGKGSKTSRQAVNQAMKSALNLAIIKCKLLLTKTYEQGGNVAQDKELSRTGDNPTGTKFTAPKIEGKHTEDTKYFSDAGALLGRGAAGKKLFDAQHGKATKADAGDNSERGEIDAGEQQAEEDEMEAEAWHSQYDD